MTGKIQGEEIHSPLIPVGYRVVQQDGLFVPLWRNKQGEYEYIQKYWYPFRYAFFGGALRRIKTHMYEQGVDLTPDPVDMYQI